MLTSLFFVSSNWVYFNSSMLKGQHFHYQIFPRTRLQLRHRWSISPRTLQPACSGSKSAPGRHSVCSLSSWPILPCRFLCHGSCGGQKTTCRSQFSTCGSQASSSGCQAWREIPLLLSHLAGPCQGILSQHQKSN